MTKATLIRTAASAALIVMTLARRAPRRSTAADPAARAIAPAVQIYGDKAAQFIPLGISKTVVVDLPGDIKDVLVADPKIANAVVRTARRAYIIGVAVGQTNVYFFDAEGRQIAGLRHRGDARPQRHPRGAASSALPGQRHRGRRPRRRHHADAARSQARPNRSRPTISPRELAGDGARSSTASRCAAATR